MNEHRDGVPWFEAPVPGRLHRCSVWSTGVSSGRFIDRCACGAIRIDFGWWMDRNDRKKRKVVRA